MCQQCTYSGIVAQILTKFISKEFRGVSSDNLLLVEQNVGCNMFINDSDIRELATRSTGNFDKTVKLLKFKNHINHRNKIDTIFKCF